MRIKRFFLHILAVLMPLPCLAQHVEPSAVYTDETGNVIETHDEIKGQAPLIVNFHANPTDMEEFNPAYESHFRQEGEDKALMVRYEEDTEYTFTTAGTTYVTSDIQRGFDQSAIINSLTGISNAVNSGFAGAEVSRCNTQANILQTLNNNQGNLSNQLNTIAMNQQQCLNTIDTCAA